MRLLEGEFDLPGDGIRGADDLEAVGHLGRQLHVGAGLLPQPTPASLRRFNGTFEPQQFLSFDEDFLPYKVREWVWNVR